eukprot:CAMPEP_0119108528 /NCGR_PEP_ID=MMETSP1180-20130426/14956_1 /TAXON_ID=3052 ORGANISM="Chlamydomonas cf sp, Strain CCMP681" /NCGR_SAMPLE_ID=MMETSP1180 /ASSEMBLY_ACC=CAM_ASM_000741 /LENGTH=132 /DNA_ID=CAMNT_0007094153 /DNA_START=33 /DNA_END=428 /DNA_ORIENTATION=+
MGIWHGIIAQTTQSPAKLLFFGGVCIATSIGIGSVFTGSMQPSTPSGQKPSQDTLSFDDRRTSTAREQRLSAMIRDTLDGRGEDHWNAAMRGTIAPHPLQENKVQGIENEVLARAAEKAKAASSPSRSWWGW